MNITLKKFATVATGVALAASVAVPAFAQEQENDRPANRPPRIMMAGVQATSTEREDRGGWEGQGRSGFAPGHLPGKGKENNRGKDDRFASTTDMRKDMAAKIMREFDGRIFTGIVSSISGTTIYVAHREGMMASSTATTTIAIDASNAIVIKNNATSTLSSVAVGDRIFVAGPMSTSTKVIVAKVIYDGVPPMMGRFGDEHMGSTSPMMGSSTRPDMHRGPQDRQGDDQREGGQGQKVGFFRGVGNFFKGIFGFGR